MPTPYAAVLITVPDQPLAERLARGLLERKLAACVNILPGVESRYWGKDKIESSRELLLIAKTRVALVPEVASYVRQNHSYDLPEIVALRAEGGSRPYLDWIGAKTLFHPSKEEEKAKTP